MRVFFRSVFMRSPEIDLRGVVHGRVVHVIALQPPVSAFENGDLGPAHITHQKCGVEHFELVFRRVG